MRFYFISVIIFLFCLSDNSSAQLLQGTGSWRDHFPYNKTIAVCRANEYVFCATPYSVFGYNGSDKSITRITKANYLSDVGITAMEYDPYSKKVIVGYENGNIDLITIGSGINIPAIRLSNILGNKAINDIYPHGDQVYLSTGFGIVVLDVKNLEIRDTYFIGENGSSTNVYDLTIVGDQLYAATENGVLTANLNNTFLANYENWSELSGIPGDNPPHQIIFVQDYLMVAVNNGENDLIWYRQIDSNDWNFQYNGDYYRVNRLWTDGYWATVAGNFSFQILQHGPSYFHNVANVNNLGINSNACIVDEWGHIWSADNAYGLIHTSYFDENVNEIIHPQGPASADVRKISAYNDNIWIAHGGVFPYWGNMWKMTGISSFVNEQWKTISADTLNNFSGCNNVTPYIVDFMDATIDPKDNDRIFFGSYDDGLIEINGKTMKGKTRNAATANDKGPKSNSNNQIGFPDWVGVAGVTFDSEGILWCTNSLSPQGIHALDRDGVFYDFNTSSIIGSSHLGDICVGSNGYVYVAVVGKGLLVLNPNGTLSNFSDDSYKLMTDGEGHGNLPSKDVLSIEEDLDGEIWVGTGQGLVVIYNPESIFSDESYDAEFIMIQQDGNTQRLMETEAINAIVIDGSNRKWIGTRNSGAFLFSDDGLNQVYHFTERNSPIPSNTVYDIAINHENGEVFFGTEKGIMGFFSTATNFDNEMSNVRVFPNPVRPDYDGNITIDGLAYDTIIKITDIQGNLMYETISEGGRAIWNGKRFNGERPSTGVYLIYATSKDGRASDVKKITFIR